jgi:hypothetical protein
MPVINKQYFLLGTTNAALARYVDASGLIVNSTPINLTIQVDTNEVDALDEYMATIGWIPGTRGVVTAQQTAIVDPAFGNNATGTFGDLSKPFLTIQGALNAVPAPVDAATARTVWTILVSPGTYDEDLAVDLTHGKKIILASWGAWNLGLFNNANWQPSNERSITITTSDAVVFDSINASFAIQPMLPASTLDETEIAQNAGPRISGNIDLTGVTAGTPGIDLTVEAQVYGTAVSAAAINAGATDVRLRVHRSRMRRIVEGSALVLQDATESRFDDLVDIEAYGRVEECFLGNGMTIVGTSPSSNTTPGIYDTQLSGVFTGPPTDAFWFDLVTDYWFTTNGASFAGGASKRIVETVGAGPVTAQQTAIVDPAFGNDATGTFGDLSKPFLTIQAALSAVPTPVDAATARTVWTILVSPGTYDEDLAVDLTHGKKIILASWGPWNLGLFNNANWQPSNTRNITITTSDNVVFDFINPSFSIEPMLPAGTGDETEAAQHAVPRVSGQINLTGVTAGTPTLELFVEAQIYGVAGVAIVAGTTDVTLRVHRSRMRGTVTGSVLILQDATESRFDDLVDIEGYGRIEECFLGNGMTIVATSPSSNTTPGIYDSQLSGVFTGPATDAFWFDLVTDYWFTTNGASFAGGTSKRIVETVVTPTGDPNTQAYFGPAGTLTDDLDATMTTTDWIQRTFPGGPQAIHVNRAIRSVAIGDSSSATGVDSFAQGSTAAASAQAAHAEGANTTASGLASHAEGSGSTASGNFSHAEGAGGTSATGIASHAEGEATLAQGDKSHAEGTGTQAFSLNAHAEGVSTAVSGPNGHAEGNTTKVLLAGTNGHAEGLNTTVSGAQGHAEGENTTASGADSHAEGFGTTASGAQSHAEGSASAATNAIAHAEGNGTLSSGIASHSEGSLTQATGGSAHAEGTSTVASNLNCHAEGSSTTANAPQAHAEGSGTTAGGVNSHAQGEVTQAFGRASDAGGVQVNAFREGQQAWGSGQGGFAVPAVGKAQTSLVTMVGEVSGINASVALALGPSAGPLVLEDGKGYLFTVKANADAVQPGPTRVGRGFIRYFKARRDGGVAVIAASGVGQDFGDASTNDWTFVATAVGGNIVLTFTTGAVSSTATVTAEVSFVETAY